MNSFDSNKGYVDLLLSGDVEKAEKIRKSLVPQKLIKFVPLGPSKHGDSETANESKRDKRNLDTLQRGNVWFSKKVVSLHPQYHT